MYVCMYVFRFASSSFVFFRFLVSSLCAKHSPFRRNPNRECRIPVQSAALRRQRSTGLDDGGGPRLIMEETMIKTHQVIYKIEVYIGLIYSCFRKLRERGMFFFPWHCFF